MKKKFLKRKDVRKLLFYVLYMDHWNNNFALLFSYLKKNETGRFCDCCILGVHTFVHLFMLS